MNVNAAILGFLSWRPLSGYDLKKLFIRAPFIYWSGNNNQIYKALVELERAGLVVSEVERADRALARKEFSLTEEGLFELEHQLRSEPETEVFRNPFLIQLAWSDLLDPDEVDRLLARYEEEVFAHMRMSEEEKRRRPVYPGRTKREAYVWDMIAENKASAYRSELAWVRELRNGLADIGGAAEGS